MTSERVHLYVVQSPRQLTSERPLCWGKMCFPLPLLNSWARIAERSIWFINVCPLCTNLHWHQTIYSMNTEPRDWGSHILASFFVSSNMMWIEALGPPPPPLCNINWTRWFLRSPCWPLSRKTDSVLSCKNYTSGHMVISFLGSPNKFTF